MSLWDNKNSQYEPFLLFYVKSFCAFVCVQSHVDLDSMRSNRTYSVEVQAVSYWGQTQLKGPRAIIHFTTQHSMSEFLYKLSLYKGLQDAAKLALWHISAPDDS